MKFPTEKRVGLVIICVWIIAGQLARLILNRLPFHLWVLVFDYELLRMFIDVSGGCAIILGLIVLYQVLTESIKENGEGER